jgi:transposase
MLQYAVPPGYQRQQPIRKPKLGPWLGVIDAILEEDKQRPSKQRHSGKRIFERLREEHGFTGGYTIVKDYVRSAELRSREMFIPLTHAPGEAQVDFGEALVVIAGVEQKAHYLAMDLPYSDDCFVAAFPAETTEAFLEGHVRAFAYFGGVPTRILYDNTKIAVARILGGEQRQRTRAFSELESYYLFADKFGRPAKGNDKGKVEGLVGYARRNFMVPIPRVSGWGELNARLETDCRKRRLRRLRGHTETIGERFERDHAAMLPLPATPYEACDEKKLLRFHKQIASYELLIVDELGFVPLSKTGAELLFEMLSQRYERGSTLLTSNLPFAEWTEVLGSERLTGALLDRLTHHVHILEMNDDSYRLKQSRRKRTPTSERASG